MKLLYPADPVMLSIDGYRRAMAAGSSSFNPHYGLVDSIQPYGHDEIVNVLWEDGETRTHFRSEIVAWADYPIL